VHIGHWVLNEACRQMREWQDAFPDHGRLQISVNLSGRQFVQNDLARQVEDALTQAGLASTSLKLEVTETVLMQHADEATAVLTTLRGMGIQLLMDDFGTGYSSLSYLHRFPMNSLKIDASFVRRMDIGHKDASIVQTIVALARSFGMDLIAEGVETPDQLARLRGMSVDYGQGYHFAKPLDKEHAESLIASWPKW
jgi:EAL domain-containing protein (putative c-di-GMP-specific phosphodiesterase class I)